MVDRCDRYARERRLCPGHLVMWRLSGSPEIFQWVRQYVEHRDRTGQNRYAPVIIFMDDQVRDAEAQLKADQLTDEEARRMFGDGPEEMFEV